MIAGFIFLRLRGILGKRTGFEGKVPSQFEEVLKELLQMRWLHLKLFRMQVFGFLRFE